MYVVVIMRQLQLKREVKVVWYKVFYIPLEV